MLAEIGAGLSSLNAAKQIVQGLNSLNTTVAVNDAKINLQGLILDAQQGLFAAQQAEAATAQRIAELEQEIVRLKDWSAEAESYELADTGQGAVAYHPKAAVNDGQPSHWLCPNCYQQRRKSFLQPEQRNPGRNEYLCCSVCSAELIVKGSRDTPQKAGTWGRGR